MAIIELQRRQTEVGRIRLGQKVKTKSGKEAPSRLETFRFTSPSKPLVERIAQLYGGDVQAWNPPRGAAEWEVVTKATSVPVVVPPQDIDSSQFYELWSAGGCQRRCSGVRELIADQPCVCDPANRDCKMHTRVNVMLRDVPGIGVWRLDTGGYYAGVELPGMVELLSRAQGMVAALLELRQRTVTRDGQTKHFVVPVLHVEDFTPGQLLSGQVSGQPALGAAPQRQALPAGPAPVDYVALANGARDADSVRLLWKQAHQAGVLDDQLAEHLKARVTDLTVVDDEPPPDDQAEQPSSMADVVDWPARFDTANTMDELRSMWTTCGQAGALAENKPAWFAASARIRGTAPDEPAAQPATAAPVVEGDVEPDKDLAWGQALKVGGEMHGWNTPATSKAFREHMGRDVTAADGWTISQFVDALKAGQVAA